jgi:hypothetical protein
MANTATLRIRRVKCVDEIGSSFAEAFGNDEIHCAVFSADLRGLTKTSGEFGIWGNFNSGDVAKFNPPKRVSDIDLAGKTGEVEVGYAVLLFENQLTAGQGMEKAWAEWVKTYKAAVKDEMMKRGLTVAQAYAVAQQGYPQPPSVAPETHARGNRPGHTDVLAGGGAMATSRTGSPSTAFIIDDDLMDPSEGTGEEKPGENKETTWDKVVDGFFVALAVAVAAFTIKFGEYVLNQLVSWSQDKYFPPMAVKAKFDASTEPEGAPPVATGVVSTVGHGGTYELEWDILLG